MNTNSKRKSVLVIIGTAHGIEVSGKCSPDGTFREYKWSRMMCHRLVKKLQEDGYRAIIDSESINEIGLSNRAQIANNYCSVFGSSNVAYVSIHNNAAPPVDGKWHSAKGWQCHVAPNASEKSKKLASLLYKEAESQGIKVRRPKPKQDWWPGNYTVLTKTKCPAVLTENMFQDSKDDVEFLLSEEGQRKLLEVHVKAIEKYVDELVGITTEKDS